MPPPLKWGYANLGCSWPFLQAGRSAVSNSEADTDRSAANGAKVRIVDLGPNHSKYLLPGLHLTRKEGRHDAT